MRTEPGWLKRVLIDSSMGQPLQIPLAQVESRATQDTEVLARELTAPTHQEPPWSEFEWHIARAVAAMQGVSSLLHARLRWEGPDGWRRFLAEQWDHSLARYRQIASLLEAIDSQARRNGLPLVSLKGAALHAIALYSGGERPMGDIDLLVREGDIAAISQVLDACGYAAAFTTHRHQVFEPRLKRLHPAADWASMRIARSTSKCTPRSRNASRSRWWTSRVFAPLPWRLRVLTPYPRRPLSCCIYCCTPPETCGRALRLVSCMTSRSSRIA